MPKKKEQLELKILELFGGNSNKRFSYDSLLNLLPKTTRREKLYHSLQVLMRQQKLIETEPKIFGLNPKLKKIEILKQKQQKKTKANQKQIYEGIVDISNTSGTIFIMIDGIDRDPIVRNRNTAKVFEGDRVLVELVDIKPNKRPEATILKVLERKVSRVIGQVQQTERDTFVIPISRAIKSDFYIGHSDTLGAKNGDYVLVQFVKWDDKEKNPRGRILEILDSTKLHHIEMNSILIEKGFEIEFEPAVLKELEQVPKTIEAQEIKYREDYRNVFTLTIDPADARDFDDAISLQKLKNGHYEIGVHIADVSHFVKPGTELDRAAYERGTSVYLPDRVAPMLPELLSNDLCSLNPMVERYAFAVIFEVDLNGKVYHERIAKTIIKSDKRYSYEEAQEVIETSRGEYAEEILILDRIAKIWRKERFEKGAISFVSPEVRFVLDENGSPIDIYEKVQKDSNLLIEDYMLKANVCVAKFMWHATQKKKIKAGVYRNHDLPSVEKLLQFTEIAYRLGRHKVKGLDDPLQANKKLNDFLASIAHTPESNILNQLAIRSMAKAQYSTDNIGHYGLAFEYYTHFTSPIRRYPDLLVHRLLSDILYGVRYTIDKSQLEAYCMHCNTQEKLAAECERDGIKYKQIEYLSTRIGQRFEGMISGAIMHGFWVELTESKCEGFVELAKQFNQKFDYDAQSITLKSLDGKYIYSYGDIVTVEIFKVDIKDKKTWFRIITD